MRAVYERDRRMRERADHVFLQGDPRPHPLPQNSYVESLTAERLRKEFETPSDW